MVSYLLLLQIPKIIVIDNPLKYFTIWQYNS